MRACVVGRMGLQELQCWVWAGSWPIGFSSAAEPLSSSSAFPGYRVSGHSDVNLALASSMPSLTLGPNHKM